MYVNCENYVYEYMSYSFLFFFLFSVLLEALKKKNHLMLFVLCINTKNKKH